MDGTRLKAPPAVMRVRAEPSARMVTIQDWVRSLEISVKATQEPSALHVECKSIAEGWAWVSRVSPWPSARMEKIDVSPSPRRENEMTP